MSTQISIAPPRIGTGAGWFIAGLLLLALGIFAALAGANGQEPSAVAVASFCLPVAALLIAIGFWVRLFGLLELRLIDLQRVLTGNPAAEPDVQTPRVPRIAPEVLAALDTLSVSELHTIIDNNGLDPGDLSRRWRREDLVTFIKAHC
jgi:hypothetical protein